MEDNIKIFNGNFISYERFLFFYENKISNFSSDKQYKDNAIKLIINNEYDIELLLYDILTAYCQLSKILTNNISEYRTLFKESDIDFDIYILYLYSTISCLSPCIGNRMSSEVINELCKSSDIIYQFKTIAESNNDSLVGLIFTINNASNILAKKLTNENDELLLSTAKYHYYNALYGFYPIKINESLFVVDITKIIKECIE